MRAPLPIAREHRPSIEYFQKTYAAHERPVVITGALEDWKPMKAWTREYVRGAKPNAPISVDRVVGEGAAFDYEKGKLPVDDEFPWERFVDTVFDGDPKGARYYLGQANLTTFPTLAADATPPPYFPYAPATKNLWIGSTGNVTKAHFDTEDNFLMQVRGRKRLLLFPSTEWRSLYPSSPLSIRPNFSQVDFAKPDRVRFPKFQDVTVYEAELGPGEMLYLPIYWFHEVYTLEGGISVNFWWDPTVRQALRPNGLHYWPKAARQGYLLYQLANIGKRALRSSLGQ
jgi:hypothetical protein